MASKFIVDRSKLQNDLLKELITVETSPDEFKKAFAAASRKLPNNSYLAVNPNIINRFQFKYSI